MSTSALQLYGCTKRVLIEKRRNSKATCCECCSHLIIIGILVIGYSVSVVEHHLARKYTDVEVKLPPANDTAEALQLYNNITRGPLIVPDFDQYIAMNEFLSDNVDQLGDYGSLLSSTALGQSYTNLLYKGSLHFAPRGQEVTSLMDFMNKTYTRFASVDVYVHDSEDAGINYILNNLEEPALALIVLRQITPDKVNYLIRQNYTTLPNTNQVIDDSVVGLNTDYQQYFFSGFLSLERAVNAWAFEYTNSVVGPGNPDAAAECTGPPEITLVPFPTPKYDQNPFYQQVGFLLGLAIVMSTMYPMSRLTKAVVEEKELRMREVMKIMGLRDWVHQLSWFLPAFVLFLWIAVSCAAITRASFLTHSDAGLVFLYFFLFTMSEINFAFLVSVFFSNSKLAAIVAPVVLFAALMPRYSFLNTNNNEMVPGKYLCCLLSPSAFAFGADMIAAYEYTGVGIQLSNAGQGEFNFFGVLLMLWADFFIYGFLAWYLDQVLPHEHGSAQHPLFFLNYRFWCPRARPSDLSEARLDDALRDMPEFHQGGVGGGSIEAIPEDMRSLARVRIKNLRKRYPDGNLAVRDLSLSMLEGQITCLLGHNGAGKTTTIGALTGLTEATSGEVGIYGCSLRYDLPAIRQMTGICPQHNVLYPQLTVLEHLYFFGNIKGLYGQRLRTSIDEVISKVGLTEKRHALSAALSGGMKRKLSLAIAFIGDPKFLLLDEPTSGMDPYSRRSTWELLQKCKAGRVVLLTTHFMEEADTLADRIAIMSEGSLRCSGSALFLKTQFGVGYLLSISKTSKRVPVAPIEDAVQAIVPQAKVASSVAGEVIFQMPITSVPRFADLFSALRDSGAQLGVGSYGISLTTLEQVFISLAREARQDGHAGPVDDHAGDWPYWARKYALDAGQALCSFLAVPPTHSPVSPRETTTELDGTSQRGNGVTGVAEEEREVSEVIPLDEFGGVSVKAAVGSAFDMETGAPAQGTAATYRHLSNAEELPVAPTAIPATAQGAAATAHGAGKAEDASPSTSDAKPTGASADGVSKGTVPIQFVELYRKRLIIASRDVKGLFFQLVFPALQIALIMLILTISVNPAGRTVILNGNMFDKYASVVPAVTVAGPAVGDVYRVNLDANTMSLVSDPAANSSSLSDALLSAEAGGEDHRMGAYVFGDQIPLQVTVDWTWVKSNSDSIGGVVAALPGAEGTVNNFLANEVSPVSFNLSDAVGTQTVTIADLEDLAQSAFNISLSQFFNLTDFANTTVAPSGVITVALVSYRASDNSFVLQNVTATLQGTTVERDDVVVPASDFVVLLPDGTITYRLALPSQYTAMHNSTSPHGVAAFYSELVATAFRQCSPSTLASPQYVVKNHPLPITTQAALEIKVILAVLTALFILVPLCYIPASFVSFLVKERVSKSKHLQIVSSVSPYLYWSATYSWDTTLYLCLVGFIMAAFFMFGDAAKVFVHSPQSSFALFCLLVSYGLSAVPLSYLYSMMFDNFSTAQITIMVINFMTGFVMVLAYYIMINVPQTYDVGVRIVHFFRFFPPYNVGEGLINLAVAYYRNEVEQKTINYFEWGFTGRNIVFMLVEAVGYFLAVLLTEHPLLRQAGHWLDGKRVALLPPPPPPKNGVDTDVAAEQERVKHIPVVDLTRPGAGGAGTADAHSAAEGNGVEMEALNTAGTAHTSEPATALLIRDLVKTYPPGLLGGVPKHAVRGVSLACSDGERFGLLGINGAGKTTMLGILTGDLQPTSGEVFIGGRALSDPATMSMIGYCPQVDPLLDLMTAFETLWFFGRIRGIDKEVLKERVADLVDQVGLGRFAHKPCGTYSGGNKRKLSLAVALIGDPRVLFLDEPSTGMDPEARRNMWTVIERLSARRCVVLVTHSMEEVEALCTRMGVMVSGRLQCIGSAQHLKSRFGMGYQVEVRSVPARVPACIELCEQTMAPLAVEEVHGGYMRLRVDNNIDLAAAFSALESNKAALEITDYSVSQCTLEQVFLRFAKDQEEETGPVAGMNVSSAAGAGAGAGAEGTAVQEEAGPPGSGRLQQWSPVPTDDFPTEPAAPPQNE